MQKKQFNISGMHCRACKTLIETEVMAVAGVDRITVDHQSGAAEIEFDEQKTDFSKIEAAIKNLGYVISDNSQTAAPAARKNYSWPILSAALVLILVYILINNAGTFEILSRLNEKNIGLPLIFLIGLLASFHCVGMCGGLIISFSAARLKKNDQSMTAHWHYNAGRVISYTVVGGVLGGIGSFFGLNPNFTGTIIIAASIFMALLGLSLLTGFKFLDSLKLRTPDFIAKFLYKNKHSDKPHGPLAIGLLTAFMPCGPLQAMQIYAVTTGSVTQGALAMLAYSLGTVPLLLGFGKIISAIPQTKIRQFVRISGLVVIVLAIFMFNRGLTNFGLGAKAMFLPNDQQSVDGIDQDEVQTVRMKVTFRGYEPNVIYLKRNVPVRWIIDGAGITGCTDEILLPDFNIKQPLSKGETIIEFTPTKLGEIKFSCWMRMVWGKFVVID